jgi:hypothetical protein
MDNPVSGNPSITMRDIWGSASDDIFAVGDAGTILHFDGAKWSIMTTNTSAKLHGVGGSSATDVFAVGEGGIILHYDGTKWSIMTSPTVNQLRAVWAYSENDVFAAGDYGVVLHNDGTAWEASTVGINNIYGVWGTSGSDVFAVADKGVIFHYDGKDDGNNGNCPFTAVLGKCHPQLKTLRQVRDEVLVKSAVGQRVIAFYYANGGLLARVIEKLPIVKHVAKNLLELILPAIKKSMEQS